MKEPYFFTLDKQGKWITKSDLIEYIHLNQVYFVSANPANNVYKFFVLYISNSIFYFCQKFHHQTENFCKPCLSYLVIAYLIICRLGAFLFCSTRHVTCYFFLILSRKKQYLLHPCSCNHNIS